MKRFEMLLRDSLRILCGFFKEPPLTQRMGFTALFLAPLGLVVGIHLFRPMTVVHVSMHQLLKKCAVQGAKVHGASLNQESSLHYAQTFKGCVEHLAHKKNWVITDVQGCWGDPKTLRQIKDVTEIVEHACCGGER